MPKGTPPHGGGLEAPLTQDSAAYLARWAQDVRAELRRAWRRANVYTYWTPTLGEGR